MNHQKSAAMSSLIKTLDKNKRFEYNDRYYLPTPPLGQDTTQGQFLSGV